MCVFRKYTWASEIQPDVQKEIKTLLQGTQNNSGLMNIHRQYLDLTMGGGSSLPRPRLPAMPLVPFWKYQVPSCP